MSFTIKQSHLNDNFNEIVKVLKENPFATTQSFEKLEPKSAGLYSRRLKSLEPLTTQFNFRYLE
jgi:Txe/YoeB family toxin of Txe-Axe toxin-antitoxin module